PVLLSSGAQFALWWLGESLYFRLQLYPMRYDYTGRTDGSSQKNQRKN
ncbi:MAG: hypothetical protein FD143_3708, partial [Ignavibacteria bacterium]